MLGCVCVCLFLSIPLILVPLAGAGLLERNEIYNNYETNVMLQFDANPTFKVCVACVV
jgi:hypothetical protein